MDRKPWKKNSKQNYHLEYIDTLSDVTPSTYNPWLLYLLKFGHSRRCVAGNVASVFEPVTLFKA